MQDEQIQPISAIGVKVAIIVSSYHSIITNELARGARGCFIDAGGKKEDCLLIPAPGAWELPLITKRAIVEHQPNLAIAIGCIIKGETNHDQVISHAIANGLMETNLEIGTVPISMGILTCQNIEQAQARAGGDHGNKGEEAMHAGLATLETLRSMDK